MRALRTREDCRRIFVIRGDANEKRPVSLRGRFDRLRFYRQDPFFVLDIGVSRYVVKSGRELKAARSLARDAPWQVHYKQHRTSLVSIHQASSAFAS